MALAHDTSEYPIADYLIGCKDPSESLDYLTHFGFLIQRIEETGFEGLLADAYKILESPLEFTEAERHGLTVLVEGLEMSRSSAKSGGTELLASQLLGRLGQSENPVLSALLDDLATWQAHPWYAPIEPTLIAPNAGGVVLKEHTVQVSMMRFTYGGDRLVTAGQDSQVIVWDTAKRIPICRIPTNSNVQALAAAERAPFLAWSTMAPNPYTPKQAVVWDTDHSKELQRFDAHRSGLISLSLSHDGRRLAAVDQTGLLILWDVASGKEMARLDENHVGLRSLALDATGQNLLVAHGPGMFDDLMQQALAMGQTIDADTSTSEENQDSSARCVVYRLEDGQLQEVWQLPLDSETLYAQASPNPQVPQNVHFSCSGDQVAVLGLDALRIYQVGHLEATQVIEVQRSARSFLMLDDAFRTYTLTDGDGSVQYGTIDATAPTRYAQLGDSVNFFVNSAIAHPTIPLAIFALQDGSLLFRENYRSDGPRHSMVAESARHKWMNLTLASLVAISPDGQRSAWIEETPWRASIGKDAEVHSEPSQYTVHVTTFGTQEPIYDFGLEEKFPTYMTFSPDGRQLLITEDARLWLFDLDSGQRIARVDVNDTEVWAHLDLAGEARQFQLSLHKTIQTLQIARFSDDGRWIAATSVSGRVHLWSQDQLDNPIHFSSGVFGATGLAFVPGTSKLVIAGQEASTLASMFGDLEDKTVHPMLLSAGMQMLPGSIQIWDLQNGECIQEVDMVGMKVFQVAISPDGKRGISVTAQGKLDHWDVESGKVLSSFFVSRYAPVEFMALVDEGRIALTAAQDGYIRAWDLESESIIASFLTNGAIHTFSASQDGLRLIASDSLGWIHHLEAKAWHAATNDALLRTPEDTLVNDALDPFHHDEKAFAAVRQLGQRGSAGVDPLLEVLERAHEAPYSRADRLIRFACQALQKIAPSETLNALSHLLHRETDSYLLGYVQEAVAAVDTFEASQLLLRCLESPRPDLRHYAAGGFALHPQHTRRVIPGITDHLLIEPESTIRSILLVALSESDCEAGVSALLRLADCGIGFLETEALGLLEATSPQSVFELLRHKDTPLDRQGKLSFVKLLGGIAKQISNITEDDEDRHVDKIHSLQKQCLHHLQPLLNDEDDGVRLKTIEAITHLPVITAVLSLIEAFDDTSPSVRRAAAEGLAPHRADEVTAALIQCLQRDDDLDVQKACIRSLAKIGSVSAHEALFDLLNGAAPPLRQAAALALAEHGTLDALFPLFRSRMAAEGPIASLAANEAIQQVVTNFWIRLLSGKTDFMEIRRFAQRARRFDSPETVEILSDLQQRLPSQEMKDGFLKMLTFDQDESTLRALRAALAEAPLDGTVDNK